MSIFKIIPKNKIPNDPIEYSKRTRIIALYVALVLVAFNIYRFLTTNAPYLSPQVTSISTLIGAISSSYFFLIFFNSSTHTSNIKVICGVFPILSSTLTITENHLNPFITMNSPIKISLMLAMMSIMIFMLYEMRSLSYKHYPRSFIISSFIAALLLSMFSVAYIVSYSANILPHAEKSLLSISIISLSFLIYILSRIFDALKQYKSIN